MAKWVYAFGNGAAEGTAEMRNLLGGKGANLAEMCNLGLPVPPGFTITTEVCTYFYQNQKSYPPELKEQVKEGLKHCEDMLGKKFGDPLNPLLVSVRSGARISMPGMMDTVLNLGLNDETVKGLAKVSNNERFAYDSYRRFLQMYSDVVLGIHVDNFEKVLENIKNEKGYKTDNELNLDDLKVVIKQYRDIGEKFGKPVPQDPEEQLWGGIGAVFGSWMVDRAITYRKINDIPGDWGTAVNVQSMVFGNSGDNSATGVCFSRNPATGDNAFYGEYLKNAQGEDVVAGIRTPQPMSRAVKEKNHSDLPCLEDEMPEIYKELVDIKNKLEAHYKDMQDMEFTIQDGKLWMLQTRNGKRTGAAALKIAVDMVHEGLISKDVAITRVSAPQLDQLLHPTLDPKAKKDKIASGLPASPGAACGKVVFSAADAEEWVKKGEKVVLVRIETSPEDIGGMHVSEGIITARGGMTSHAAVVARGMGTPCVSGIDNLIISYENKSFSAGGVLVKEGDFISLDGSTGEVFLGKIPMVETAMVGDFAEFMAWVDDVRKLQVWANADTPNDAKVARDFGAQGIGLCRTEHMFFEPNRILHMRAMILASSEQERRKALEKLLPYQKEDFINIFKVMDGLPVTIRLLDPPLHEFLPHTEKEQAEIAKDLGVNLEVVKNRTAQLHEQNPMLGLRGCRLGITYPEVYEMQARAIFEAAVDVSKNGVKVLPDIMIPLVGFKKELDMMKNIVDKVAEEVQNKANIKIPYLVGTMIELPRAALMAEEIAKTAQFFSFGTNDLTQTTLGLSRDDAGPIISLYKADGIFLKDPFASIDTQGVGKLVQTAVTNGKKERADIQLGVCGEHGGDPASIAFFNSVGLDYVSCSPYRVPIARLAAAQAVVEAKK